MRKHPRIVHRLFYAEAPFGLVGEVVHYLIVGDGEVVHAGSKACYLVWLVREHHTFIGEGWIGQEILFCIVPFYV